MDNLTQQKEQLGIEIAAETIIAEAAVQAIKESAEREIKKAVDSHIEFTINFSTHCTEVLVNARCKSTNKFTIYHSTKYNEQRPTFELNWFASTLAVTDDKYDYADYLMLLGRFTQELTRTDRIQNIILKSIDAHNNAVRKLQSIQIEYTNVSMAIARAEKESTHALFLKMIEESQFIQLVEEPKTVRFNLNKRDALYINGFKCIKGKSNVLVQLNARNWVSGEYQYVTVDKIMKIDTVLDIMHTYKTDILQHNTLSHAQI